MTLNSSYTVTYAEGRTVPGKYAITVKGIGNYTGTVTKTLTIAPQPLDASRVTLSSANVIYNGKERKPTVTAISEQGAKLTLDSSYTVTYPATCKATGTYTITVTGKGNFTGTVKKTFKIAKQTITASNVTLSATTFTYNGKVQKPIITLKTAEGVTMTEGSSYTVTYSAEPKAKGTYTVTIQGKGNFTGSATFDIKIK